MVVKVRSRQDLENLSCGALVNVYGEDMAFHGFCEHFNEPKFVRPLGDQTLLKIETPIAPTFRKISGGIKYATGYASKTIDPTDKDYEDYYRTARLGGLIK